MTCVIPFGELIPNAAVRFTKIDGIYYLSIRDIIMAVCQKDDNQASRTWKRDITDLQKDELKPYWCNYKFPGRGQQDTPIIQYQGALTLMLWLPGDHAKNFRGKAAEILTRYFAGDYTLVQEIEKNSKSESPVNVMARHALENPDFSSDEDAVMKKRRKIQEMDLIDIELQERKQALESGRIALKDKEVAFFKNSLDILKSIRNGSVDDRTVLQYEDLIKNATISGTTLAITNGEPSATKGITLSVVAAAMGYKCTPRNLIDLGKLMARKYREIYNEEPPKHDQLVNGAVIPVNSYMERDRTTMEELIKDYMTSPAATKEPTKKRTR